MTSRNQGLSSNDQGRQRRETLETRLRPLQIIEPLIEKTWGQGCVIFGEWKNKERNGEGTLNAFIFELCAVRLVPLVGKKAN